MIHGEHFAARTVAHGSPSPSSALPLSCLVPCATLQSSAQLGVVRFWACRAGHAYRHVAHAAVRVTLPALFGAVRGVGAVASRRAVALLELLRADGGPDQGVPSEVKQSLLVYGGAVAELSTLVSRRAGTQGLLQYEPAHFRSRIS